MSKQETVKHMNYSGILLLFQNKEIGELANSYLALLKNTHTIIITSVLKLELVTSLGQLYLYQKCGFRVFEFDQDFFTIHYDDEIIENHLILKDMIRLRKILN